jgi:hypothetical protein
MDKKPPSLEIILLPCELNKAQTTAYVITNTLPVLRSPTWGLLASLSPASFPSSVGIHLSGSESKVTGLRDSQDNRPGLVLCMPMEDNQTGAVKKCIESTWSYPEELRVEQGQENKTHKTCQLKHALPLTTCFALSHAGYLAWCTF